MKAKRDFQSAHELNPGGGTNTPTKPLLPYVTRSLHHHFFTNLMGCRLLRGKYPRVS